MTDQLTALTTLFTEFYYWVTIVLMFLIHVGFTLYEVGCSRRKNMMHTLMKNIMAIPLIIVTFYLFGWWIYFAFRNGPGITGGLVSAPWSLPWNELMGMHLGGRPVDPGISARDAATWARLNGVFFGAFLLFSIAVGAIISGAVIERIRSSAFWLLAVLAGSVTWIIDASWGWSDTGWMVSVLGYHDAYASGVVHALCGGSALGILIPLGPRIGRFRPDGSARNFYPQNTWLVVVGLFLILTGFWGFYAACNIPVWDIDPDASRAFYSATTIYLTPTTLSGMTLNFLLSFAGGMIVGYYVSRGDAYWTFACGIGGIITASAGNDLYHPLLAHLVGAFGAFCIYKIYFLVERRFKIDDAVGVIALHGGGGVVGVLVAGFLLWGYPSSPVANSAVVTPWGQATGAILIFGVLGFLPCYVVSLALKKAGLLRVPEAIELAGLDYVGHGETERETRELVEHEMTHELVVVVKK